MVDLWEVYSDVMTSEPMGLNEFMERVRSGAYGSFSPEQLNTFLRELEQEMLANIEAKAGESPQMGAFKDRHIAETRAMIEELSKKYGA